MQIAELDASRWTEVTDIYSAIYDALGSQYDACNINALMEGLYWDHAFDALNGTAYCESYKLKPPFGLKIVNASAASKAIIDNLTFIQQCLAEAHQEFREMHNGRDVMIGFEIA